jgi:hypothetical protein
MSWVTFRTLKECVIYVQSAFVFQSVAVSSGGNIVIERFEFEELEARLLGFVITGEDGLRNR